MIRSIKRNIARQRMKQAGIEHINKGSRFARLWRNFVDAPKGKKLRSIHGK